RLVDLADDLGAQLGEALGRVGVPAVQVIGGSDRRLAFGGEAGQHQRTAAAQVVRLHDGAAQGAGTVHLRAVAVHLDVGAHLAELGGQLEPAVEDPLVDV